MSIRSIGGWLAAACVCIAAVEAFTQDVVYPGEQWAEKAPAELKLDPARLDAVADALGGRGCIIKDGYVVKTWGSQSERSDWFSSAKPVLSTVLMFAIQEGKVPSVDARIADYGWELPEKDRSMTFRHLGAMTGGYARPEPPGAAWAYNDYAIQLYQKTLFDRVFKDTPENVVAAPERFGALCLQDGLHFRGNRRISASVRDFARIAWLWLNKGQWNGKQLVRRELMEECQRPQAPADLPTSVDAATDDYLKIGTYGGESSHFSQAGPGIYGFNWWFNGTGPRHPTEITWPDAPRDTFMSLGLKGNHTAMIPSLRLLVVSALGDWGPNLPGQRDSVMSQRLRLIAHAGATVETNPNAAKPSATQGPREESKEVVSISPTRRKWHDMTLTFRGPQFSESSSPNPFLDYRLDVTFRHDQTQLVVPGYFAADGDAAETSADAGDRWRVHFVPPLAGKWTYQASFRRGENVAISDTRQPGEPCDFNGATGEFTVEPLDPQAPGFLSQGRLQYVGQRYLRFAETGRPYLKSGADSPENLLAYDGFDGTKPTHRFGPHMLDARSDDPTWQGGRGRNLLGAMNYLAGKGVNSIYFLTMNVKGDGKDVWPWTDSQERARYDCSKLEQWERLFSHLDRLGIALHVVTQEQENDQLLDRGDLGPQRKLYYRELVARFAHHLSVVWNLGEENTNTTAQRQAFAEYLHRLDPYNNPVVIHTFPSKLEEVYEPLLGFKYLEGASMQTNNTRAETRRWIERSSAAGRQWFVCLDEIGPADTGVKPDAVDFNHDEVRRDHLWPHFMSGGAGVEWLFGYKFAHHDVNLEDFRSRDHVWDLTRYAVDFFQTHLPFADMQPHDELLSRAGAYCLAQPGKVYAVYLPEGGSSELELPEGEFDVHWFDPSKGGKLLRGDVTTIRGAGKVSLGSAPRNPTRDWVVLVKSVQP